MYKSDRSIYLTKINKIYDDIYNNCGRETSTTSRPSVLVEANFQAKKIGKNVWSSMIPAKTM